MDRISRHEAWMQMAEVMAKRSTCYRGNVGAVLVGDGGTQIMSVGYNGPPPQEEHCKGNTCELTDNGGCQRSIHAEKNAIDRAIMRNEYRISDRFDLYVTDSPCELCSNYIVAFRYINRVFYRRPYRIKTGLDWLHENQIEVYRMTPSGFIISELSGTIIEGSL